MRYLPLILICCSPSLADNPKNLVRDPGFEARSEAWMPAGDPQGSALDSAVAHSGKSSVRLTGSSPKSTTGVHQSIVFDPPLKRPLHVSGWSKALAAEISGACVIVVQGRYDDGTVLPQQDTSFPAGTHDWQYAEMVVEAAKPLKSIEVIAVLAQGKGTVWFDDIEVALVPFAFRGVHTATGIFGGASVSVAGDLTIAGKWKVELTGAAGVVVSSTSGDRAPVIFNWAGASAGDYTLRLSAIADADGERIEQAQKVSLRGADQPRAYAAWIENSMKRVLPQALPDSAAPPLQVRISLAGNEYESFQICLLGAPGREIRNVRIEVSDLRSASTGARIPASEIEWQQVGFVKIERLRKSTANEGAWPGWWPDPLLPVEKFDLTSGFTQPVWVTVQAPAGTHAGEYSGTIRVLADDRPRPPVSVSVRVQVYGFELPREGHLKTAFALMNGYLEKIYGKPLTAQRRRQFGDFLLKHRLNPDDIARTDLPEIDDLLHFNSLGLNAFNIASLVPERGNRTWVPNAELSDYTPSFMQHLVDRLDPYISKLRDAGLIRKSYIYTFDERDAEFFPVMREYFGMVKRRYPEVHTMTTSHIALDPKVLRDLNVDWIVPLTSWYDFEKAEACRRAGLEVWGYVAVGPREPYANFMADDPLLEARVLWWQIYHQKMDGFLFLGVNIWERRGNTNPIDPGQGPLLEWSITTGKPQDEQVLQELHGDGQLVYPGKNGPIGSIRLANIRDGLEDYEYLWLLAQKDGVENARQSCQPVTRSLTEFTQDPTAVYAQRDRIAKQITVR
ncbi:MAG TPA: glycoside hydrolase domain-containing protein [Bryobacteraceae bacterium]|nr:glycoside hydrolase domain-containing protein [Bryobacteraceae bacterium]